MGHGRACAISRTVRAANAGLSLSRDNQWATLDWEGKKQWPVVNFAASVRTINDRSCIVGAAPLRDSCR
jgi:hypothetical protein